MKSDRNRAARKPSFFDQPRWVMIRSLLIPGWGQAHNRAWLKAVGVAALEVWLVKRLGDDRSELNRLAERANEAFESGDEELHFLLVNDHNLLLDRYQSRQWLLGGVVTLAMLDAYIDAHFRDFKIQFEADPALPAGESAEMRISLRWTY